MSTAAAPSQASHTSLSSSTAMSSTTQPAPQPQKRPSASTTATAGGSSSNPKPPTTTDPTAYLDPLATLIGTYPITIGAGTVIHPRARLVSTHAPIVIGENCLISERSRIGEPGTTQNQKSTTTITTEPSPLSPSTDSPSSSSSSPLKPTVLESQVLVQPLASVGVSAHLSTASVLETSASIAAGVEVGEHAKVCAGCSVTEEGGRLGEWEVVYGQAGQRRRRARNVEVEDGRLKALQREREGTGRVLREGSTTKMGQRAKKG